MQYGLEDQPFRDEAVERRKRRYCDAADEKGEACERHAVDEAAQFFHIPLSRRGQAGAGPEEKQTLEEGVVENVKQRRGEGERRRQLEAVCLKARRKTESTEDA